MRKGHGRSAKVGYVILIVRMKNKKVGRVVKLHILVCFAQNGFVLDENLRNWTKKGRLTRKYMHPLSAILMQFVL